MSTKIATSKKIGTIATSSKSSVNTHLELQAELYRAFHFFNKKFADNKLETPVITIQSRSHHKAHGWFCREIWEQGGTVKHEINISAESLAEPIQQTFNTLLHEMAHQWNFMHGIDDCTDQQRHNNHFKVAAEQFGLEVSSCKRFGPAHTKCSPATLSIIEKQFKPKNCFDIFRKEFNSVKPKKEKKESGLKPCIVDAATKELIAASAESLGCDQKNLVDFAVKYYMHILATKPKAIPAEFKVTVNEKKSKS